MLAFLVSKPLSFREAYFLDFEPVVWLPLMGISFYSCIWESFNPSVFRLSSERISISNCFWTGSDRFFLNRFSFPHSFSDYEINDPISHLFKLQSYFLFLRCNTLYCLLKYLKLFEFWSFVKPLPFKVLGSLSSEGWSFAFTADVRLEEVKNTDWWAYSLFALLFLSCLAVSTLLVFYSLASICNWLC